MITKTKEKEKAVRLRKDGFSYSEILKEVPVAKSTLSLWLKSVGLSKPQEQRLTEKRLDAILRGAKAKKEQKFTITKEIKDKARKEIGNLSDRESWLMGVALYWAEGSKEKDRAVGVRFSNSDPEMIRFFLKWLLKVCKINKEDIYFEIYLHETTVGREEELRKYWAKLTGYPLSYFRKTIWKNGKIRTKRKNIGDNYHGQLRVCVKKSTNLNRKIAGWVEGICKNCRVV